MVRPAVLGSGGDEASTLVGQSEARLCSGHRDLHAVGVVALIVGLIWQESVCRDSGGFLILCLAGL